MLVVLLVVCHGTVLYLCDFCTLYCVLSTCYIFTFLIIYVFVYVDAVPPLEHLWSRSCYQNCILISDTNTGSDGRSSQGRDTGNSISSTHSAHSTHSIKSDAEGDKSELNGVCRPIASINIPKIISIEQELFTHTTTSNNTGNTGNSTNTSGSGNVDMAWSAVTAQFPHIIIKENLRWLFELGATATSTKRSSVLSLLASEGNSEEEIVVFDRFMRALGKPQPDHFVLRFNNGKLYSVHCLPIKLDESRKKGTTGTTGSSSNNNGSSGTSGIGIGIGGGGVVPSVDMVNDGNKVVREMHSPKSGGTTTRRLKSFVRNASMALIRSNSTLINAADHIMLLGVNEITDVLPTNTSNSNSSGSNSSGNISGDQTTETVSPLFTQNKVDVDVEMASTNTTGTSNTVSSK